MNINLNHGIMQSKWGIYNIISWLNCREPFIIFKKAHIQISCVKQNATKKFWEAKLYSFSPNFKYTPGTGDEKRR